MTRALKKAPLDVAGQKRLCWDFSTHRGCHFGPADCIQSHEPITSTGKLDWTTQAELIRRGGLRNGKKVPPTEVDARVAQLRQSHRAEEQKKREEGGKATRGSGPEMPEEYVWFETEEREGKLSDLRKGPDATWMENVDEVKVIVAVEEVADDPEFQDRVATTRELDNR